MAAKPEFRHNPRTKTTLHLPDELMREIKFRAVDENAKLEDVVTELLRLGLSGAPKWRRLVRHCVRFPLVQFGHPAKPSDELTPERVAASAGDGEVSNP